jgi:zinc transporter
MTLITGLFGINVGGMPWLESHLGFWWVVFGMFATAILTFLILHWRRLF